MTVQTILNQLFNNIHSEHNQVQECSKLRSLYYIVAYFPFLLIFPNFTNRLITQENLFWILCEVQLWFAIVALAEFGESIIFLTR